MNHEINKSAQESQPKSDIQSMLAALEGNASQRVQWTADFSASGTGKDDDNDVMAASA